MSPAEIHVGDDADLVPSLSLALADPDAEVIVLHPGRYVEQVVISPRARPLLIRSADDDPAGVVLSFDLRQGDRGPSGMHLVQDCATLTVDADDVTLRGITIANTFDKDAGADLPDSQALALRTRGTRILIERCRLLGKQDTVLLDTSSPAQVRHVHLRDCLIEGDVDFVYGAATALIEGGEIRSVGRGYIAAPSTAAENPRGFCFHRVALTAAPQVPDGGVRLARPWHPGGRPEAVGYAHFVDCRLGPHIAADRWQEMGGFSWRDAARFGEADSTLAPGAVAASPEHALASDADPTTHLAGWDGVPPPTGRIHIVSDSTASEYDPSRAPRTGWGQVFGEVTGREVVNHAVSGMSTTSLIASGTLEWALTALTPGDLLLIAFGHNDAKPDERHADPYRAYPAHLRRIVGGARARGATPVLLTPVERRSFEAGRARSTHGAHPQAVRRVAGAEEVALIDLTVASRALWQAQGEEGSKASFLWLEPGRRPGYPTGERDDTHLSRDGALAVARLVSDGLAALGLLGAR